jgi:DNA-binding transcriptional MerR regulator
MKRGGGRRYYRPEDVNLLKGIRFLLYGEGYTIKGVQRILKEQGIRHVATVWEIEGEEHGDAPAPVQASPAQASPAQVSPAQRAPVRQEPAAPVGYEPEPVAMEPRVVAPQATDHHRAVPQQPVSQYAPPPAAAAPAPVAPQPAPVPATASQAAVATPQARLSQDDVRQLKAALFELIECKRLLDASTQVSAA